MKLNSDPEMIYYRLVSMLPLFKCSHLDETSQFVTVTYLCPEEYTYHARRFVIDTLTKSLTPGKQLEIVGGINFQFQFAMSSSRRFYIAQEIVSIRNESENKIIRKNLPEVIQELKQKLPSQFVRGSNHILHPIFMPRNEEETIRNLIVLSKQIKYVKDLPQVSIHYEKQTHIDLTFTIIVARLLKGAMEPLRKILEKSRIKLDIEDVRFTGYVKQKYVKEGAIFRITIDKRPFFRPDHSVDLLKARQKIVGELSDCLGEFRDFNGGMILKQDEALNLLRQDLGKLSAESEFLLENYFYSLKPGIMQTVHDTATLNKHYELLRTVLKSDLKVQPYQVLGESIEKFFLCFITAQDSSFKESVLNAIAPLKISTHDLTTSFLEINDTSAMGFILRVECPEIVQKFRAAILSGFNEWCHKFYCPLE